MSMLMWFKIGKSCLHILVSLECVFNNASANNMIQLITKALITMGALTKKYMTRKINSFGINGVIFQGIHNGVTMQIQI